MARMTPPPKSLTQPLFHWVLIDHQGKFRAGITTAGETPTENGSNSEGWEEIRVEQFPQGHEFWDPKNRVFVPDEEFRARRAREASLDMSSNSELYDLIMREVKELILKERQDRIESG